MLQDKNSGAAADRWGRETARQIASQIGATMQRRGSNEALLNGQNVVIKCAAVATDSVGVTYKMLEKLDAVIGAFQIGSDSFELWSLNPKQFEAAMRETKSRGASAGKVAIVRKGVFLSHGKPLGRVRINAAV
jgi:hypothetical protein